MNSLISHTSGKKLERKLARAISALLSRKSETEYVCLKLDRGYGTENQWRVWAKISYWDKYSMSGEGLYLGVYSATNSVKHPEQRESCEAILFKNVRGGITINKLVKWALANLK